MSNPYRHFPGFSNVFPRTGRRRSRLILFPCLLVLALAALAVIRQPFLADEINFARAVENWEQDKTEVPHPPGYVHLIQISYAIFGESEWVYRLPGIAATVFVLLMIPHLVRVVFGDSEKNDRIATVAMGLFVLNPLTVQNRVLVDIDNTVLTACLVFAIWAWYYLAIASARRRVTGLVTIFFVSFWFKLTTPVMLLAVMLIVHLVRREIQRCIEIVIVGGLAGSIFVLTFVLYSQLTGFPSRVLLRPSGLILGVSQMIHNFPQSLGIFVLWLGPFQVILWGASLWSWGCGFVRHRQHMDDLLHLYALVVTITYAAIVFSPWYYPKYHAPVIPVLSVLIAANLVRWLDDVWESVRVWVILSAVLSGVLQVLLVGDPLRRIFDALYFSPDLTMTERLERGLITSIGWGWLVPLAMVVAMIVSMRLKVGGRDVQGAVFGGMLTSTMLATMLIQITADYSPRYLYGQSFRDLRRTTDLVQEDVALRGPVLVPKSVWYYTRADGGYIEMFVCPGCTARRFIDAISLARPAVIVWAIQNANSSPQVINDYRVQTILDQCYTTQIQGDFWIFRWDCDEVMPSW